MSNGLPLPFTGPWLLAPMEGVTEPCFRDLVLARNDSSQLGGAFTEFLRVVDHPLPRRSIRAHLGERSFEAPVGLQLMGSNVECLAETAARAIDIGAPLLDLNFGCPARGALRTCAGSALLRDPDEVERIVRACVEAAPDTPVTAKIRAGFDDDSLILELASATEAGGASMLTVHCRTKKEGYQDEVDWNRIARAVSAVGIPVCGNGGVRCHEDLERMRNQTGCRYVMVGRAALGDPWIFGGREVSRDEAARFLLEYYEKLSTSAGMSERGAAGRVKQLLRHWRAGKLLGPDRQEWLGEREPQELCERLRGAVAPARRPPRGRTASRSALQG